MIYEQVTTGSRTRRTLTGAARVLFALKLDGPLIIGLGLVAVYGLIILYSASGQSAPTIYRTLGRLALGTVAMLLLAQVNPNFLRRTSPWLYAFGIFLLFIVYGVGHIGKGAQRWLDLGIIRFQPSELMKLAVPMTVAWFLHDRALPPSWPTLLLLSAMIFLPVGLVAIQPDLGTAALIAIAGVLVIVMAGLTVRIMGGLAALGAVGAWFGWSFMHDYQRKRVLTFLDPQTDPLGAGYHIIQSQIAIGSGGVFGKGWMSGSQAQLEFLPERSTDFIFAVIGEEFGLLGLLLLLLQQQAEEAELLADDGEDEVGGALGEEFELCLAAVHPALAEHTAGADRDLRLDDVVAGAEWIGLRVEKHEHALALVVVHEAPAEPGPQGGERQQRHHHAHAQACEDDDQPAGERDERGRAQVGLDGHQPHGQQDQHAEQSQRCPARRQRPLVHVPGAHHRYCELHQLGRLEAEQAEIQPALRAHTDVADRDNDEQQQAPERVHPRRAAAQEVRVHARQQQHGDGAKQQPQRGAHHRGRALAGGAVQHDQPERGDERETHHQRTVDFQLEQHTRGARERAARA